MASMDRKKKRNREKLVVEYDEEARKEFLTGFSRRKKERRKRALQQLDDQARRERIETRKQMREDLLQERKEAQKELRSHAESIDEGSEDDQAKLVEAMAQDNERVEQIVDDFSAHAFGSALVTVTTTVADDEPRAALTSDTAMESDVIRLPKNFRVKQSDAARQANRLRDRMSSKGRRKAGVRSFHSAAHVKAAKSAKPGKRKH